MKITRSIFILIYCAIGSTALGQKRDSVIFSDYGLTVTGPINRNWRMDAGIERIEQLSPKLFYGMQLTITGGKFNGNFGDYNFYNPAFFSVCFQPFHLLVGKKLQFETGFSAAMHVFRYNGYHLPDTFAITDRLSLFYLLGIRYNILKYGISMKVLVGPQYVINLQRRNRYFADAQGGEIGISYRLRRRKVK